MSQCEDSDDEGNASMNNLFREPDSWREDTFDVDYKSEDGKRAVSFTVKGLRRDLGQTLNSTGLTIWRASFHLNEYLFNNPQRYMSKSVCELGCGLGIVSILISKLKMQRPDEAIGASSIVIATDGDDDTLSLLQRNIDETNVTSHCHAEKLWWSDHAVFLEKYKEGFDVLLGADIIYEASKVASLMSTVAVLLKKPTDRRRGREETQCEIETDPPLNQSQDQTLTPPPLTPNPTDTYDGGYFFLAFARRNVPIDMVMDEVQRLGMTFKILSNSEGGTEPIFEIRWKEDNEV